ncbi:alpha/beta-hydrolase [Exidia glandulosa HHB12029]|uniref:Alpha/beta-hydrolase n=1 Tax=Exidia glandulosa HHB12029 TaxID=1314781 RepID=A0A165JE79_EXIGL|nr:alpha/beta-hydrolase [Exidia glandulosa HHB12029]
MGLSVDPSSNLFCWRSLLAFLALVPAVFSQQETPAPTAFDWTKLSASPEFNWVPCYDQFQCARFEVPLDYTQPDADAKVGLAVLKLASKYPQNDTRYRGPIFYNPGGPGESGVELVHQLSSLFVQVFGDEFDHVGWDTRGVGMTEPALNLFPTESERHLWLARQYGPRNYLSDGLGQVLAHAKVTGELAVQRANVTASHMGTADVVRDIMAMNTALGRDKVMYWGVSYGTVLGQTLAAMFPDKIERLVIDSVMDANEYYVTTWSKNFLDTDKVLDFLFNSCSASPTCPLHEKTSSGVRSRYERIMKNLEQHPVPVVNGSTYGVVDLPMVKSVIFNAMYSPYNTFIPLAQALADLERGDGNAMYTISARDDSTWRCDCEPTSASPPSLAILPEVLTAIACGDGAPVADDYNALAKWARDVERTSDWAEMFSFRINCAGWKIRAANPFAGPYGGNTSHPIFIMGNTADPVTSLSGSLAASKRFTGSTVVAVEAPGHGSISVPSVCATKLLRAYMRDGTMPPQQYTLCKADRPIFPLDNSTDPQAGTQTHSEEDMDLLGALEELLEKVRIPTHVGV